MANFGTATKIDTRPQVENRLIFEFPSSDGGPILSRVCPFFENPRITETQQANLVTYDVLGRAGSFFGYTGAKSRAYNVEFYLTLPHIINTAAHELFTQPPMPMSKKEKKKAFFDKRREVGNKTRESKAALTYEVKRKELLTMINNGLTSPTLSFGGGLGGAITQAIEFQQNSSPEYALAQDLDAYQKPFLYAQAVQMVLFWIKLIRASVLNNQRYPSLGPPIIRLKFGELYDYISCLATKYSVSWDDIAGYDVVTLLPNRIKVTLSLVQVQRNPGTERTYNPEDAQQSRNRSNEILSGWESFEGESWEDWLTKEAPAFQGTLIR